MESPVTFHVALVGSNKVGKTSFLQRYVHGTFSTHYRSTIGMDLKQKEVHEAWCSYKIIFYDLIGIHKTQVLKEYLKNAPSCVILFANINEPSSFLSAKEIKNYITSIEEYKNPKFILFANYDDVEFENYRVCPAYKRALVEKYAQEMGIQNWSLGSLLNNDFKRLTDMLELSMSEEYFKLHPSDQHHQQLQLRKLLIDQTKPLNQQDESQIRFFNSEKQVIPKEAKEKLFYQNKNLSIWNSIIYLGQQINPKEFHYYQVTNHELSLFSNDHVLLMKVATTVDQPLMMFLYYFVKSNLHPFVSSMKYGSSLTALFIPQIWKTKQESKRKFDFGNVSIPNSDIIEISESSISYLRKSETTTFIFRTDVIISQDDLISVRPMNQERPIQLNSNNSTSALFTFSKNDTVINLSELLMIQVVDKKNCLVLLSDQKPFLVLNQEINLELFRNKLKANNIKHVEYHHSATSCIWLCYEMLTYLKTNESSVSLFFKDKSTHLVQFKLFKGNTFIKVARHFINMLTWLIDFRPQ